MRCFYVDWAPGRIGVVNSEGELLAATAVTFLDESQMGELSAVELAVPFAQTCGEHAIILTDSLSAVKMISGSPYKPHPKAKRPEDQMRLALKIRAELQWKRVEKISHIVSWIPRQSNLAHRPLSGAEI